MDPAAQKPLYFQTSPDAPVYVQVSQTPNDRDEWESDVQEFRAVVDDLFDNTVMHPRRWELESWNSFMMFMVFLSAYLVPFEVAYTERRVDMNCYIGFGFDCVFFVDMVMQFFIAYETPGFHYCYDHKKIVYHYIVTGFLFDCISVVPIFNLLLLRVLTVRFHWIVSVLRSCRMLRLTRYTRILKRWKWDHRVTYIQQEILINAMTITIACHWMACLWGVAAAYDKERNWVVMQHQKDSTSMPYADMEDWDEGWKNYFLALYFGIYVLTGIGLGDIVPVNVAEHAASFFIMIFGAVSWATVIASVVGMVAQKKERDMALQRQLDALNSLSHSGKLDPSMQTSIREYLTMHQYYSGHAEHDVVQNLSPKLQMEVTMKAQGDWMMKVKYFRRLVNPKTGEGTQFLVDLAWSMELRLYTPGELIKLLHHLCVVTRGIGFLEGGICSRHSVWGTDFMIKNMKLRKGCVVLCLTYMQIKAISLEQLYSHLSRYPQELKAVQRERVKLIVVRGMAHKAHLELERRRCQPENVAAYPPGSPVPPSPLGRNSCRRLSFGNFRAKTPVTPQASNHPITGEVERYDNDIENEEEIVGQANMPEYVGQIKKTQDQFREEVKQRLTKLEESVGKIAESLESVRTTPWNTA